MDNSKVSPSTV